MKWHFAPPECANALSLIDQGATVYDPTLGISWLKDANLAASNSLVYLSNRRTTAFSPGLPLRAQ
jgi:hypothetical protein